MRRLRTLALAALLVGFTAFSTGCDRTTGALLVGGAIIGTALVLDAADDHDHRRHHRGHGYDRGYHHGGGHGGGYHGGHDYGYHGGYDYCD